jgi:hypothetical protein
MLRRSRAPAFPQSAVCSGEPKLQRKALMLARYFVNTDANVAARARPARDAMPASERANVCMPARLMLATRFHRSR